MLVISKCKITSTSSCYPRYPRSCINGYSMGRSFPLENIIAFKFSSNSSYRVHKIAGQADRQTSC